MCVYDSDEISPCTLDPPSVVDSVVFYLILVSVCVCVCVYVCACVRAHAYAHGLQVEIFSLSSWSNINFRSFLHSEDNFLNDSAHGQTVLCIFGGFCQKKSFLLLSYQQKILSLSGLTGNKCPFLVHLYLCP